MPKAWADSAVPPHPATTAPFGMVQFTGPRNKADAALVAEALTALPALLDEVDRLRADRAIDRPPTHWSHRPGDTYVVIRPSVRGNDQSGFRVVYDRLSEPFFTVTKAWEYGVTLGYSDDFNLAAYRDGQMVAMLWVDPNDDDPEIVDSDPDVVADVADAIGVARPGRWGHE